jgi:opacity protein-like surface antigen
MFRKSAALIILSLGFAAIASAQTSPTSFGSSAPSNSTVASAFANVSFAADQQRTPARPAASSSSEMKVYGRAQIGFLNVGGSTGLDLGAGITTQPFNNKKVEVLVDGNFVRIEGFNGLYISGNAVYDFVLTNEKVTPYAGAGIGILHFSEDTQTKLQILGGIKVPMQNKREFFGELRILFTDGDTTTFVIGGIRF